MDTDFSAKEPSLGYFYQIRYSLLLLLDCDDEDSEIRIENIDDIDVISADKVDLYQTKMHIKSVANLTNSSTDFWKTIRVWSEAIKNDTIDIEKTILSLITTASVGESSYLKFLTVLSSDRDILNIRTEMLDIANNSTNETNKSGYMSFISLSQIQQDQLISKIRIVDASPSIKETLEPIKKHLRYSTLTKHLDSFIQRLEGWWFEKCILQLCDEIPSITKNELLSKITDIRESFQTDNLPDDFATPLDLSEKDIVNHDFRVFVKQLKLISIGNNALKTAVDDFNRAYEQRSKWIREELLNSNEEDLFENRLFDHWQNIFNAIKDDCEGLPADELEQIGKEFYRTYYINNIPPIRIREKFQSEYMTRGSCHILSDKKKIGWHPNFNSLLNK